MINNFGAYNYLYCVSICVSVRCIYVLAEDLVFKVLLKYISQPIMFFHN